MVPPVRAVVFDIGGVLVEFRGVSALAGWIQPSPTPTELWRAWLSSPVVRAFETGGLEPGPFATSLTAEMQLTATPEEFLTSFAGWPSGAFPGAADLLRRIPAGVTRATLSNSNVVHWPRFISEMGLHDLFDRHFPSHETGKIKPDADAFEHVLRMLGCDPSAVLFLDDQPANVGAAISCGLRSVCVTGIAEAEHALIDAGVIVP